MDNHWFFSVLRERIFFDFTTCRDGLDHIDHIVFLEKDIGNLAIVISLFSLGLKPVFKEVHLIVIFTVVKQ
jgi:hypothetical protein